MANQGRCYLLLQSGAGTVVCLFDLKRSGIRIDENEFGVENERGEVTSPRHTAPEGKAVIVNAVRGYELRIEVQDYTQIVRPGDIIIYCNYHPEAETYGHVTVNGKTPWVQVAQVVSADIFLSHRDEWLQTGVLTEL